MALMMMQAAGCAQKFHFVDGDGYRDLLYDEKPVWRDMIKYDPADHVGTYKAFKHVFAFDSDDFITKGAGGKYPHHRGIFFGYKTQHGDFWHCPDVSQRHVRHLSDERLATPLAARSTQIVEWIAKDGAAVVRDTRQVTTTQISDTHYVLDFDITVEALTDDPIQLGGDAHHAGFHFRAAQEVAEGEGSATYIRPEGAKHIGNDIWENCDWIHATFPVKGKTYAVTHFDAPTNPRPIQYSSRPYGRFGSFFKGEVAKSKPLKLRYRIIVRDGGNVLTNEQLAREYKQFSDRD